jgi:hypothetical protein
MKKLTSIIIIIFAFSLIAIGQDKSKLYEKKNDKERVYKVEFDNLWKASVESAKEHFALDSVNKEEGFFTFNSGQTKASWGFSVNVSLSKGDEGGTRIKLNVQKRGFQIVRWGAEGKMIKKFFESVDKFLETGQAK